MYVHIHQYIYIYIYMPMSILVSVNTNMKNRDTWLTFSSSTLVWHLLGPRGGHEGPGAPWGAAHQGPAH